MRILLAEDDSSLREAILEMLEFAGHEVVAAANGAEALRLLRKGGAAAFDLLFTDIMMPVMTGLELARRAVALAPDLPVLCMSAHPASVVSAGITSVPPLEKPFRIETMLTAVERCVAVHHRRSRSRRE
jgi:two-component system cell cycle response regulator CpdR